MPEPTEEWLRSENAVGIGRVVHPRATGMLQVHRSIELFGTAHGSTGFRSPATASGPIYCLPLADGEAGQVLTTDGASNLGWTTPAGSGSLVSTIGASLGFAGTDLSVNERAFTWVPFSSTITEVVLLSTPSGSVSVGIWATGYDSWPPTSANSITGGVPVTITSGVKTKDSTLSGWTTALASDMGVIFNVDSVSGAEQVTCVLKIVRNTAATVTTSISGSLGLVGETLNVNDRVFVWVPFACTVHEVVALGTPSGSVTIGVWATGYASFPPSSANSITGSEPVAIATGVKYKDASLTTWTTAIASDSVVMFNVDSVSGTEQVTCVLRATVEATSTSSTTATDLGFGDGSAGLVGDGTNRPHGGDYGGAFVCPP